MDPEVLARETGISLAEAEELLQWSQPEPEPPQPAAQEQVAEEPDIAFLQSCFPDVPLAVIRIKYGECRDLEQASDLLLNWQLTKNENHQFLDKRLQRQAKLKHKRDKKQNKEKTRKQQEIDTLVQVIDDLSPEDAKTLYEANGCQFDKAVSSHFRVAAPHVHAMIAGMETLHIGGALPPAVRGQSSSELDFETAQARLEAELENLASYRRTKGVPGVLISESLGRIANLRNITAESRVIDALGTVANRGHENVVDFHNMTVKAAVAVCEYKVREWKGDSSPELYLITGAGRHSHKGVPVVKNAVRDVVKRLNDYRYFIKEEEGAFLLTRTMR